MTQSCGLRFIKCCGALDACEGSEWLMKIVLDPENKRMKRPERPPLIYIADLLAWLPGVHF